jgi:hypothetical protein
LKSIGSFLVGLAALAPVFFGRRMNRLLTCYCSVTALHGFVQGVLLFFLPIEAKAYGFEWYLARLAQLFFAVIYAVETANRHELTTGLLALMSVGVLLGVTPHPNIWFNWLAFCYSLALVALGVMIVAASDLKARIMGAYWLVMGSWQYAFATMSQDSGSSVWSLNWWLPSAISIAAFLALAIGR